MNRDLMMSVLTMDSYNRGYNSSITVPGLSENKNTQIGRALVYDNKGDLAAQAANFYAIAYTYNGEKIISYRGTDNISADAVNAYAIAIGNPATPQGSMAIEFYKTVVG